MSTLQSFPPLSGPVLVTGASSGIGRGTAILLSSLGARVIVSGQNPTRLQQTLECLSGHGHVSAPFDLSQLDGISSWIADLAEKHGPLSGLVHSAGIHSLGSLQGLKSRAVDDLLRVNVASAIFVVRAFRRRDCAARGGSIVLVSSVAGLTGQSALSAYSASKAALMGLARAAAIELAPENLRINCVAPGVVQTEMTDRLKGSLTDEQFDSIERMHPLGLGLPEDVAHAIAFLISPQSRWITGTTLVVDGGYSAR